MAHRRDHGRSLRRAGGRSGGQQPGSGILLVIGILIVQIIRYRLEMLYATTLVARALISATLLWLFVSTGDPFFAVILVIVLIGVALTGVSYVLDRRDGTAAA